MKLILIRLIRTVMIILSVCALCFCVTYIVNPQFSNQNYNYDITVSGRILGTAIPIIVSILGIFPYKTLRKGIYRKIFRNILIIMSLSTPTLFLYWYYSTGGTGLPLLQSIGTIILFANLWAFFAISRTNDLKEKL